MELMLHSILTSRVVLHIRAWTEATPAWSDGLTELNTNHLRDRDARILNRLEPINFSTTKRLSLG
jgi:hypothetical protein